MKIIMACFVLLLSAVWSYAHEVEFKPPVRLMDGEGKFINDNGKILYPTPVLMDIDNDGQSELVIGDLWGYLRVYERSDKALTWIGPKKLTTEDGKELKVSNW